ncbi:MAG: lysozyme inhibitor LprI family protein [Lysobacteraceae bacterium]
MKIKILIIGALMATLSFGAGFDCKKASTSTEKAICTNKKLSDLDSMVANQYKKAMNSFKGSDESTGMCRQCVYNNSGKLRGCEDVCNDARDGLKDNQKEWIKNRDKCVANVNCIQKSMIERIEFLKEPSDFM